MKYKEIIFTLILTTLSLSINAQGIRHFLPDGEYTLNSEIPSPHDHLGYDPGERHVSHDELISYMRTISKLSKRIIYEESGQSYQGRPLIFLTISSEDNLKNIDKIQKQQLKMTDPSLSSTLPVDKMPIVMWFGYSVHGNEASGVNASLAVVYYLAAAQGSEIERILNESVIIIQPAQNPDGINRFASWVNSTRSYSAVLDPFSREFREPAPSSRSNHYWFDLNRDWLPVQHPESYHRLKVFMKWHPVLVNDYHEQGSTNGAYFSPGIKNSTNTLVPAQNRRLTEEISLYHARILENDGVLFFTKEGYDNFYTGKGASYPDMIGAIGILYEQPSSRGHIQKRNGVLLKFPDIIRHQALCTYSAINAGIDKREELNRFKIDSYKESAEMAKRGAIKGYIIDSQSNNSLMEELLHILKTHNIDLFKLNKDITVNRKKFNASDSYLLPLMQKEYRLIRTLFDKITNYTDTTFYDISAWTLPLALNLKYEEILTTDGLLGERVTEIIPKKGEVTGFSNLAYLFEIKEQNSYKLLYSLLEQGLSLRVGDLPFRIETTIGEIAFEAGAVMIPVRAQDIAPQELNKLLQSIAIKTNTNIHAAKTSFGTEFDLGSSHFRQISLPKIALITGRGASYGSIGELWHLLDHKYSMPASIIDAALLSEIDLSQYNTIVINGNYRFPSDVNSRLKDWANSPQNIIIGADQALATINEIGVADIREVSGRREYASGVILKTKFNKNSPLFYGVLSDELYLFKRGRTYISEALSGNVLQASYTKEPLVSGYLSKTNLQTIEESPAILAGRGVIYFCDNPNFRGYWYGSSRLFMNALFFRELMPDTRVQTK
ncbi:MAG: M14 family zinc carboxypeptidase [Bacteroidales bacterium]|nr:M14 family zinc carboxypeptidase [Bacteroidales bacterium]